jgi:hypothetical protein
MMPLVLAILLSAAAVEPGDATLTLLDGATVSGRVTAWDAGRVVVAADAGPQEVPRARLVDLRFGPGEASAPLPVTSVEFIDGTRICATEFTAAGGAATITTPYSEKPLEASTELIRIAELKPPGDATAALWKQLAERQVAGDLLIVAKREGGLLDYLAGVVGDVSADEVSFDYDGQKLPVKRSKIAAISYYHAKQPALPEATCQLTLMDGSQIPAREVALADDGLLRVTTPAGIELAVSLVHVVRGDFSAGKLAYLSDLKPLEMKWTPRIAPSGAAALIAAVGQPRNNVSFTGSALSLAWPDESRPTGHEIRTYARGLAIRSRTDLAYRLPAGMRRFTAMAGIDPATAGQGHVVLEIRADDRVLWEGEIDGKRPPVELDLDLGTARRLQFHVDYGRNLDYGDRLHLVEARVTK